MMKRAFAWLFPLEARAHYKRDLIDGLRSLCLYALLLAVLIPIAIGAALVLAPG